MVFASLIVTTAEAASSHLSSMMDTVMYPIIAIIVFFFLAMVSLSYRHVANRHAHKADAYAQEHARSQQQSGHGH